MNPTLIRTWWISLSRDRVALLMTFVLPIAFFSIFALVFGGQGRQATARVRLAVVDEDRSVASRRLVAALEAEKGLRVVSRVRRAPAEGDTAMVPLDRAGAERMVKEGDLPAALILPAGLDTSLARFDGGGAAVEMLTDPSDPIAPQVVAGLLQKAAMTAAPDLMAEGGIDLFARYSGGLTPAQRRAVDQWMPMLRRRAAGGAADSAAGTGAAADSGGAGPDLSGLIRVKETPVVGDRRENGMVSFYAAGIAVMFLLFSCAAMGGALLDELDSGTLERVLASRVGMNGLLAAKFVYLTLVSILAVVVMFLWAALVFRLDLVGHLPGFAVMTIATAMCAASFGLVLATACRTRAQLGGISTIVILCISALGGTMFPRFLMSEAMQKAGLATFTAWALDGYVKVFWRDVPVGDLLPQVAVLLGFTVVFLAVARVLARRWEAA